MLFALGGPHLGVEILLEGKMRKCWDIKGCPASHYMNCVAYKEQVSCWEMKEGCICGSYSECEECPIYKEYKGKAVDGSK